MRILVLAAAVASLSSATLAFAENSAPGTPGAKSSATVRQGTPSPQMTNEEARRREDERHKRWDARMRRVTKSLCEGC